MSVAYRLRLVVVDWPSEPACEPEEARHVGGDPWTRYERGKALIARTARSAAEYEERLRRLADREGV